MFEVVWQIIVQNDSSYFIKIATHTYRMLVLFLVAICRTWKYSLASCADVFDCAYCNNYANFDYPQSSVIIDSSAK